MPEQTIDNLSSQELFASTQAAQPELPSSPPAQEVPPPEPVETPAVESPPSPPEATQPEPSVPSWRLREEAEARRLAEDRSRALEARLNEIATHLKQGEKKPDFFEDPDKAAQQLVMRALQPYAEETRRGMMYLGKMVASVLHGAEKVDEAEKAFLDARESETLDPADYERVVQSPNRYDAVVQWHKRQAVLTSVGDDPAAWFEKQLEARMADPAFQAKLLEKVRGTAAAKPGAVKLPPSLSKSTSAVGNGNEDIGDMSDKSLFAFATK